jgi:hypothetical protein
MRLLKKGDHRAANQWQILEFGMGLRNGCQIGKWSLRK